MQVLRSESLQPADPLAVATAAKVAVGVGVFRSDSFFCSDSFRLIHRRTPPERRKRKTKRRRGSPIPLVNDQAGKPPKMDARRRRRTEHLPAAVPETTRCA